MVSAKRLEKINKVVDRIQEGVVVLEDIHDPHNAAAVMRSCDAFGIHKVYFIFNLEKKYNPKRIGKATSSSANKWLEFKSFNSTKDCFSELKKEGFEIVATVLDDVSENIFDTKLDKRKIAIVFGNEHRGLSKEAIKLADRKVFIPMIGMVQSLNISVTAGIILFEINRQRKILGLNNYLIKPAEKEIIKKEFALK